MLNAVRLNSTQYQYKRKFHNNNDLKSSQNVSFNGSELNRFTKEVFKKAGEGIYRAGVKTLVKGYDSTKKAIREFDPEDAKESAIDLAKSAPSKVKYIVEKVKTATREAVDEARKK